MTPECIDALVYGVSIVAMIAGATMIVGEIVDWLAKRAG